MSNSEGGPPTAEAFDDKHNAKIDRPSDCKTDANGGAASDGEVNLEVSSSSPRSASDVSSETLQAESHDSAGSFKPSSHIDKYSPCNPNDEIIDVLEDVEAVLAKGYGMDGPDIDTDGVLQKTKDKTESDPRFKEDLDMLHELYHIRTRLAKLKKPRSENNRRSTESILSEARKWDNSNPPDASRIWALIIGINEYSNVRTLKGCVNDGNLMKEYITKDLGVDGTHVRCLFNGKATRAAIIQELSDLCNRTEGDIIIIYFSGHGSSYMCPEHPEYELGEKAKPQQSDAILRCFCPVEAICPVDRGCDSSEFRSGKVPDIDDREINARLSRISQAKGLRITVILDCCHSGSATRDPDPDTVARKLPPLSRAVYEDMRSRSYALVPDFSNRVPPVSEKGWHPDTSSHVVIAACQGSQRAGEREIVAEPGVCRGIFTRALVDTLRYWLKTKGVQLTYVLLLDALPIWQLQWQTPVVAGNAKGKLLWSQEG